MKTLAGMLLLGLLIAGCGGEAKKAEPKTFDISGTFTLKQVALDATAGDVCGGSNGYDDIGVGAPVAVRNAKGETVGLGELGAGKRDEVGGWCEFPLSVSGIPASAGIFSIEVSQRGEIPFKRADADTLALTLG